MMGHGSGRAGWHRAICYVNGCLMRHTWGRWFGGLVGGLLLVGSGVSPAGAQGLPFTPSLGTGAGPRATPPQAPAPMASSAASTGGMALATPSADAAAEVARMAEAVNSIRAQNGRPPLSVQAQLTLAAQRHADGMAQSRTMSHVGPFGSRPSDRMGAAGYETCGGGENVSFGALQTVDDVARGWYDSPGHRAI